MPSTSANGITIEYETVGEPDAAPVLLISGFSHQLTNWDPAFVRALADRGHLVIIFDNRDVGRSTWLDPDPSPSDAGGTGEAPAYSIPEMAADATGLLDALGIESAHFVGYSMGGMIAQTVAIEAPERVRSLVSISSTTGDPAVGSMHPVALEALVAPSDDSRSGVVAHNLAVWRVIGSPEFDLDEDAVRDLAGANYDRAHHPQGVARQFTAIVTQPDRTTDLARVNVPTLVIHGDADLLVDSSGGVATAAAIPSARLKLIPGLGHDIHPELFDELVGELAQHFGRVETGLS